MTHLNVMAVPSANSDFTTATDPLTVSSSSWTTIGLSATVTPPQTATKVLVTVNVNYRSDHATSKGAFTIFRDGTNRGDSVNGLQVILMPTDDINCAVTISFLDSPATTNTVVYTVQAKSLVSSTSFRVSHNSQIRQIAAIMTHAQIVPTVNPTRAPTVSSTMAISDCVSSCTSVFVCRHSSR